MDQQKQQIIDRIKQAQNVLVTVSVNPSVDQLAAAIGLTIALNKMDKHGTAVFSGEIPNTIEFLKPEDTLEKNTDSLRDFIIALDKSKADKLRYKVEDQVVRIFITPYKTSLSDKDLEFSQGDFNVDVVIALGVADQKDIDSAISAHGRILHDATVTSIGISGESNLGTINVVDTNASSLSEMMLGLIDGLDKKLLDNQIATALLTGIVANTDRFRNDKTSPKAMSASAELMSAGANPQLIATELETPPPPPPEPEPKPEPKQAPKMQEAPALLEEKPEPPHSEPGELDIVHDEEPPKGNDDHGEHQDVFTPTEKSDAENEEEPKKEPEPPQPQIHVDDDGNFLALPEQKPLPEISQVHVVQPDGTMGESGKPEVRHERMNEPPALGMPSLTANASPEEFEPTTEELSLPSVQAPPLLSHNENVLPPSADKPPKLENPFIPQEPLRPAPDNWQPPMPPLPPIPQAPPEASAPTPPEPVTPASPPPFSPPPMSPPAVPMPPMPAPAAMPPQNPVMPLPPLPPQPMAPPQQSTPPLPPQPSMPPMPPAPANVVPGETLADIEAAVHSPHAQGGQPAGPEQTVEDARSAVQAALNATAAPAPPLEPIAALNAQPLGQDLHPPISPMGPPAPSNTGFSEPTPGNTPADETLDMPLPSNPFGPGQQSPPPLPQMPPPSSFPAPPSQPGAQNGGQTPPPPVPPPMLPPLQ